MPSSCDRLESFPLRERCLPRLNAHGLAVTARNCNNVYLAWYMDLEVVETYDASWRKRRTLYIVINAVGEDEMMMIGFAFFDLREGDLGSVQI